LHRSSPYSEPIHVNRKTSFVPSSHLAHPSLCLPRSEMVIRSVVQPMLRTLPAAPLWIRLPSSPLVSGKKKSCACSFPSRTFWCPLHLPRICYALLRAPPPPAQLLALPHEASRIQDVYDVSVVPLHLRPRQHLSLHPTTYYLVGSYFRVTGRLH
jgi:hypothetical protein